jgi:hypothetical protein
MRVLASRAWATAPVATAFIFLAVAAVHLSGRPGASVPHQALRESQPPATDLDDLLFRASLYVTAYERQLSALVSEERYEQVTSRWRAGGWVPDRRRDLVSDYLLVRSLDVAEWIPFRDVYEVDGRKLRDHDERLKKLFLEEPATAFERAKEIMDESARYNIGFIERNINLPTLALIFLQMVNQPRFMFWKQAELPMDGVRAWQIAYAEKASPTLIKGDGHDNPAEGVFWLDPRQGRVVKSTLRLNPNPTKIEITVTYGTNEKLDGVWVPVEMAESYTRSEGKLECRARYSNFRQFRVITNEKIK